MMNYQSLKNNFMKRTLMIVAFAVMAFSFTSCVTPGVYVQGGKPGYGRTVRPYNNSYRYGYRAPYLINSYNVHNYNRGRAYGGSLGHNRLRGRH